MTATLATVLAAWQRVVYERPPAGSLQRGVVALPRVPTAVAVTVAVVAVLALLVRARRRARPQRPEEP